MDFAILYDGEFKAPVEGRNLDILPHTEELAQQLILGFDLDQTRPRRACGDATSRPSFAADDRNDRYPLWKGI